MSRIISCSGVNSPNTEEQGVNDSSKLLFTSLILAWTATKMAPATLNYVGCSHPAVLAMSIRHLAVVYMPHLQLILACLHCSLTARGSRVDGINQVVRSVPGRELTLSGEALAPPLRQIFPCLFWS